MTRPLRVFPLLFVPALLAAAGFATSAQAEPAQRAVAQCQAELLNQFGEGAIRNFRVADISGNSRRTRVSFVVNADRRYTFDCSADAQGRILTASFDPPRADGPRLAAGQR